MEESFTSNIQKSALTLEKSINFRQLHQIQYGRISSLTPDLANSGALCRLPFKGIVKPWTFAMIPGNTSNGSGANGNGNGNGSSGSPASTPASSPPQKAFSLLSLIPCNPSLGLFFFAPIVPAADNKPALALLTGVQFFLGLSLMTRRIPKLGESRFRQRISAASRFSFGSVLVFLSGIEALRVGIPYDPWADEARAWRRWAVKNGHNPSWWHGGISYYTPMSISQWKVKTTTWLHNKINELEAENEAENALAEAQQKQPEVLSSISIGPSSVLKAGEANAYNEIHEKLHSKNCARAKEMLAGDLRDVSELNKAVRVDAVLEKKEDVVHLNEEFSKPHIQLGTHTMESTEEFEMVWANFEPWDELRQETDYDVRLIPRWRCIDEFSED